MNNIREYVLCRDDIFYFVMNYLDIEYKGFQFDMLSKLLSLQSGRTENILGHRGCGLTTASCIYALWRALFYPGESIAFLSPRESMAFDIKTIFYSLYSQFVENWDKEQTKYGIEKYMSNYVKFENKSYVHFKSSKEQMRGNRFSTVIFDSPYLGEGNYDTFIDILPSGEKFVIINTFLPPFKNPLEDVGILTTYPWYCDPKLTQEWYLAMLNSLGNADFLLKYGCTRGT